jgi:hypothetical protein
MKITIGDNENATFGNYTGAFRAFITLANTGTLVDAKGNMQSPSSRDSAAAMANALANGDLLTCAKWAVRMMPRPSTGAGEALNARAAGFAILAKLAK